MKLEVLIACPGDERTLTELLLASLETKVLYEQLGLTVFTTETVTSLVKRHSPSWISYSSNLSDLKSNYDLIIQLIPDPSIVSELEKIDTGARSGVRTTPHFHIQGSWAQLYMAMIGSRRFTPFILRDVFIGIITGDLSKTKISNTLIQNKFGKILVDPDLESISPDYAHFIQDLYRANPGKIEEYGPNSDIEKAYAYVGRNSSVASLVTSFGGGAIHLIKDEWDFTDLPSSCLCWNCPESSKLDLVTFHQMMRYESHRLGKSFRLTNEYLSNLFLPPTEKPIEDNQILFDYVLYVAFNFITDLREVNIPIPFVTSALVLKNKGIQSVLSKISHLNKFGIKFIQDYLDSNEGTQDELVQKIAEIDDLTNRTLTTYPELDLVRLYLQFLKARVPGDDFSEVARNMILTFSEINQIIGSIDSLLGLIVKENNLTSSHTR